MNKTLWAVILIVIIVAAGWFIYNKSATTGTAPGTSAITQTQVSPATTAASHNNVYLTSIDPVKGTYMTDFAGKTLYTFDKDTIIGTSSCNGACATLWPPYTSGAAAQGTLPNNVGLITRADGSMQFTWKGKPLYYYSKDTASGQTLGDGFKGLWHIIKM